jgi:signal transduction histidine kinase
MNDLKGANRPEVEVGYQEHWLRSRWEGYIRIVPSAYRTLAFAIATAQIFLSPTAYQSLIPPLVIVIAIGVYTLVKALYPFRWYGNDVLSQSVLGADTAICIFLLLSTGGLDSPFLAYSLAPVLTAALLADSRLTLSIAGLSIAGVVAAHLANPLPPAPPPFELGAFLLYAIAVCLTAILPYLINAHLRQRLHFQDVLQERQRLSHEIHDGAAQTLATLRWQVQVLRRRLAEMGIDLDEARQLETLAEKSSQDIRESLELLRTYTGNGSFLPHLQDYLKHLSQDTDIDFHLDINAGELQLTAPIQLELLRICQEALTNIRKHSRAHNVEVKVKSVDKHLKVSIADDGCGFDAIAYYGDGAEAKGHGLAVMRERAQSVGGNLVVLSQPGSGTEVKLSIPVRERRWRR